MIKALTFDLDDTLWAVGPVIHEANLRLLRWMETHAPRFVEQYGLPGFNSLRDEVLVQRPEIGHDMTKLRLALLELGLARCDYDNYQALAKAGFEVYFAARNGAISMFLLILALRLCSALNLSLRIWPSILTNSFQNCGF